MLVFFPKQSNETLPFNSYAIHLATLAEMIVRERSKYTYLFNTISVRNHPNTRVLC